MNWRDPHGEWRRLDAETSRQVVDRAPQRVVLLNGERLQEHKLVFVVFEDVEVVTSESEAEVPEYKVHLCLLRMKQISNYIHPCASLLCIPSNSLASCLIPCT